MTVLLLAGLVIPLAAWAGPPFVTDDPEIPPLHSWEINIPLTLEQETGASVIEAPVLDVNYGLAASVELMLEFAFLHSTTGEKGTEHGLSDTGFGIKWRFVEESPQVPQIALYPQVVIPTGDRRRGLGEGKASYAFPLVAQKSWGDWTVFGNLGGVLQNEQGARDFWFEGVAVQREISPHLELGIEEYGNTSTEADEPSMLGFNVGGQWNLSKSLVILFSAGHTLRGEAMTTAYLGLQLLLGGAAQDSSRPRMVPLQGP